MNDSTFYASSAMLAVATIFSLTQLPNHFYLSPTSGMWVKRDGTDKNVALIAETDLSSLIETVYLLRSPANAIRLHRAINRAKQRDLQGYSH
jgi:hypothetical protein